MTTDGNHFLELEESKWNFSQECTEFVVGFYLHTFFILDRLTFPKVSSLVKNGQKSTEWKCWYSYPPKVQAMPSQEIAYSKLTIETLEQGVNVASYQWRESAPLVSFWFKQLWIYNASCSSASNVNFEQVNSGWVECCACVCVCLCVCVCMCVCMCLHLSTL